MITVFRNYQGNETGEDLEILQDVYTSGVRELMRDALENEYEVKLDGETAYMQIGYIANEEKIIIPEVPDAAMEEFRHTFYTIVNNYGIKYKVA